MASCAPSANPPRPFATPPGCNASSGIPAAGCNGRQRAKQEIRRRNRQLLVLNFHRHQLLRCLSIDLHDLPATHASPDSRAVFSIDAALLYLFEPDGLSAPASRRSDTASGICKEYHAAGTARKLIQQIRAVRATFLPRRLPLPEAQLRRSREKEQIESAYIVTLWSKDKIVGGLVVSSRIPRGIFRAPDVSLLRSPYDDRGCQRRGRSQLYEETQPGHRNLRRTQEQLLHSEKLTAVRRIQFSGETHELNNHGDLGYSSCHIERWCVCPLVSELLRRKYSSSSALQQNAQNLRGTWMLRFLMQK